MARLETINHSRIRRDCEMVSYRRRSLVVLIEGGDPRRPDVGKLAWNV
jgi:hypothetical protein